MSSQLSDKDKVILTGRIYPAIQSCVANRYKIVAGYYVTLGVVIFNEEKQNLFIESGAALLVAIIFSIFTCHNTYNYWENADDQRKYESENKEAHWFELVSFLAILALIWFGYCYIKHLI